MAVLTWLFCLFTLSTIFSARVLQRGGFFDRLIGFLQAAMLIVGFFVLGWKLGILCVVAWFVWGLVVAGLVPPPPRRSCQP